MVLTDILDLLLQNTEKGLFAIIVILTIAWSIFIICLAFKVYGACNNIKRIADKYDPEHKRQNRPYTIDFPAPSTARDPLQGRRQADETTPKGGQLSKRPPLS